MSKVGEYVRTKYGIAKVILTKAKDEDGNNVLQVDKMLEPYFCDGCDRFLCDPKDVIKSNTNIMDLIEKRDYVNGCEVLDIFNYNNCDSHLIVNGNGFNVIMINDIKSIVTKEQFESMQYEVGEK